MNLVERFLALPVWVRWAIAAVIVLLILKGFGYVAPVVTQPGLN